MRVPAPSGPFLLSFWRIEPMPQNEMVPWGEAQQPPCGCNQGSLMAWIQANPWLAAAIAAGLVWMLNSGGKSR